MDTLYSDLDRQEPGFIRNRQQMWEALELVRSVEQKIVEVEAKSLAKFEKRGQIPPRDRIGLLLDPGSPFLILSSLAGYQMHDDRDGSTAGGGILCGIGHVSGVRCIVMVSNSAVKGGTISPAGLKKSLRAQEIALENKLPVIFLVESGGANLLYQSEIFIEGGRGFANQARLSAAGIPQITVVHGSSTAGGAYFPGMSDYVVMVKDKAKVFLAGPPLLKAATGEIATDEELGGAAMHAGVAGTAEYLAEDDREAISIARDLVRCLDWSKASDLSVDFEEPLYPAEDLLGLVPLDFKLSHDVRAVFARVLDGSAFLEFKASYDEFTVCGHGQVGGQVVGVIGNNGPLTAKGSTKAAQFIQLCCQSKVPLVFFQNTTGFMVGKEAEQSGMVKHGSKLLQAVACAQVAKITFVIGASFGAGNYGMCGRGMGPRFIFSWPNARIGVMGGQQAAKVMSMVTAEKYRRAGQAPDKTKLAAMEKEIEERMALESHVLFGTARLWDDGIIDPRDTRQVLMMALQISAAAEGCKTTISPFGVPRF